MQHLVVIIRQVIAKKCFGLKTLEYGNLSPDPKYFVFLTHLLFQFKELINMLATTP